MNIGLLDSIELLKEAGRIKELETKYKMPSPVLLIHATRRAVKIMETAVPKEATIVKNVEGTHVYGTQVYCPECKADITNWQEEWSFCPFCGQAIRIPKENA